MNQKKIIAISLIVIVLVMAGVFVWKKFDIKSSNTDSNSQGNSQTQNWEIYQNDTLKFSVEYPETFKIDAAPTDTGRIVSFLEFNENAKNLNGQKIPGYFPVISIYQWKDINNPDLKGGSWEGEKKYTNFQDFLADSKNTSINMIGDTVVGGVKAYILAMPGEIGYEAVMFEHNGGYYRISFPWTQKPLDENVKKQFLSSIKFLK